MLEEGDDVHFTRLSTLIHSGMTERDFLTVLVPLERVAARERISDADMRITTADALSAGTLSADTSSADAPPVVHLDTFPFIVVVDNLRSALNIGGLFRTADALGVSSVWLCGYSATPEHPHVARSALGAERVVPWRHVENIRGAVSELRREGYAIYALETARNATPIDALHFEFPCALLLGNERFGLDPDVVALADAVVSIPMHGIKNSLNVVSAFAIAGHAARRSLATIGNYLVDYPK
jgi:tRNA G18 (ribose-2'-O)-methylase SpoU